MRKCYELEKDGTESNTIGGVKQLSIAQGAAVPCLCSPPEHADQSGAKPLLRLLQQEIPQFFIHISPGTDEDNIQRRVVVIDLINDSVGADSKGPISRQFRVERAARKRIGQQCSDAISDFSFDLGVELPDSVCRFRRIPSAVRCHRSSRPNTASWETHLPA